MEMTFRGLRGPEPRGSGFTPAPRFGEQADASKRQRPPVCFGTRAAVRHEGAKDRGSREVTSLVRGPGG